MEKHEKEREQTASTQQKKVGWAFLKDLPPPLDSEMLDEDMPDKLPRIPRRN